jgi:phosphatidate cytidylyltransferase
MLAARIATGFVLVAIFVAVILVDEWLAPWYPLWLALSGVVMGMTALEVVGLLNRTSARPSGNTVFGGVMALVVANWAPHLTAILPPAPGASSAAHLGTAPGAALVLAWPLWTFVAVVMFAFIAQSAQFDKPGGTMAAIAGTVLAVAYVGLLGSFIIQFRWLEGRHEGLVALAALVATAKGSDVGAYTLGRIAGRHKLWPRLSPNKTVEGAVGGLLSGLIACLAVIAIGHSLLGLPSLSWPEAVGFGLVVGASAQLGDLMESMIKRDCARKDASDTLPGFGGVLDVMDSLLFAGPVAYGYWILFRP